MTDKAGDIDPYLNVKCFQISTLNAMFRQSEGNQGSQRILERGNILHFLSASGHFPGILDFVLRKKCLAAHALDKNELSTEIHNGRESKGHSALHLACMSLRQKSIEKLLLSRVDANVASGSRGDTPLHILVKMYEQQAVALEHQYEDIGADIDLEDIRECI